MNTPARSSTRALLVTRCDHCRPPRVVSCPSSCHAPNSPPSPALRGACFGLSIGLPILNVITAQAAAAPLRTTAPVLLRERDGTIAILALNRPQARNSLSESLLDALSAAFSEIAADRWIRAVVLAANGPAFCAGHDLKELTARRSDADRGRNYFRHIMTTCSAMMQQIVNLPQPVIAAVQGVASAAGCQLVASCDLAIASSAAKFATPGVDIGLFCSTPMVALSRNVARSMHGNAAHRRHGRGRTAARIGLINRVVGAGRGAQQPRSRSPRRFASKSSYVLRSASRPSTGRPSSAGRGLQLRFRSDDREHDGARRRGRHCAFIEKRDPNWEDR